MLRALAIAAIVFNHANPVQPAGTLGLGGGLTFLILLSGFNLARYGLEGADAGSFRRSCAMLAWRVAWPTFLVILLDWVVTGQRPLPGYLLFYSSWFTWHHPENVQLWYPQMLLYLLLGFGLLSLLPGLVRRVQARPFQTFLAAYLLAVALRFAADALIDVGETRGRLVPFYAWNFLLGMLAFYALQGPAGRAARERRLLVIAAAALGGAVAHGPGKSDFWWLASATALWVLLPRLRLPWFAAQAFRIVSQAAFAVFLLHLFFFHAWWRIGLADVPIAKFVVSLGGSVAIWLVITAFGRAYRAMRMGTAVARTRTTAAIAAGS